MEIYNTMQNRRLSYFLSQCKELINLNDLYVKYNDKINITGIYRINKYININNLNIEIYGSKNCKLYTYYITNDFLVDELYVQSLKEIMKKYNFNEIEVNIFNTHDNLTLIKNINRFEEKVTKKRSRKEFDDNTKLQNLINSKFKYEVTDNWVSASKTRNSALNDRCLDYYDEYNIYNYDDEPKKSIKRVKRDCGEFISQRLQDGIDFEKRVVKFLEEKYQEKFVKICESYLSRDKEMCIKTFKEMYKGTPIIYQGVLHNPENETLGSVDLLVRNDYINEITNNSYTIDSIKSKTIFPHKYYYYAVDIKNAKMHFNVDNVTLRNNTSVKPFKYQLFVYNEALKYLQGLQTSKAFILGNGWKMEKTVKKEKVVKESFDFKDKLGTIDFSEKDDYLQTETNDAIDWLHELRKSTDWTHKPPSNINIYPNMCNTNDDGYRHIKQKSAE